MYALLQYSLRDDAAVALVPVQHDLPIQSLLNHEAIDVDRRRPARRPAIAVRPVTIGIQPAPGRQLSGE